MNYSHGKQMTPTQQENHLLRDSRLQSLYDHKLIKDLNISHYLENSKAHVKKVNKEIKKDDHTIRRQAYEKANTQEKKDCFGTIIDEEDESKDEDDYSNYPESSNSNKNSGAINKNDHYSTTKITQQHTQRSSYTHYVLNSPFEHISLLSQPHHKPQAIKSSYKKNHQPSNNVSSRISMADTLPCTNNTRESMNASIFEPNMKTSQNNSQNNSQWKIAQFNQNLKEKAKNDKNSQKQGNLAKMSQFSSMNEKTSQEKKIERFERFLEKLREQFRKKKRFEIKRIRIFQQAETFLTDTQRTVPIHHCVLDFERFDDGELTYKGQNCECLMVFLEISLEKAVVIVSDRPDATWSCSAVKFENKFYFIV